jgi:outer membrane protein assembly factor BamE (lipoprotein component of BamABCDE complex)
MANTTNYFPITHQGIALNHPPVYLSLASGIRMPFGLLLVSVSMLVSLTACGTIPGLADLGAMKTGRQVTTEQMGQVIDNKTTQAEIVSLLGQPNRKAQVGAKEVWYYDFTQIGQAVIGRNISETTAFEFDAKGVVLSHYKTAGAPGTSSNPLLKAAGQ